MTPPDDRGLAVLCDPEGNITRVVRDDFGVCAGLPAGAGVVQLADEAGAETAARFLLAMQTRGSAFHWEIPVASPAGSLLLDFSGGPSQGGFLILATRSPCAEDPAFDDLTRVNNDLANLQRELYRKNQELASTSEQKDQFLGMAAHDLRSPLGAIMTYSEFLDEEAGPGLSTEHREFITTIRELSQFMLGLINDLLDVAQFESGKLRMDLAPVDLMELIRRNVALNLSLAARKQIRIGIAPAPPLPPLLLDHGKIDQVLNNLLSNAIKFSHSGTEIAVGVTRENSCAVITVRDHGQGIPPDDLPKLFQPFSRTRVRSTAGESSTGLGLSIVRRIVEAHHGTIGVVSEVGKGSSFSVRLPLPD